MANDGIDSQKLQACSGMLNGNAKNLLDGRRLSRQFTSDIIAGHRLFSQAMEETRKGMVVSVLGSQQPKSENRYSQEAGELGLGFRKLGLAAASWGDCGVAKSATNGAAEAGAKSLIIQKRDRIGISGESSHAGVQMCPVYSTHSAKMLMASKSSAFVFFPGGYETLDMFFELLTLLQLKKTPKVPIICVDTDNYWSSLVGFLRNHAVARKMINLSDLKFIKFAHDANQALDMLEGSKLLREAMGMEVHPQNGADPHKLAARFMNDTFVSMQGVANLYFAWAELSAARGLSYVISNFGTARAGPGTQLYALAKETTIRSTKTGAAHISGGGTGTMQAVAEGAYEAGGLSLGIFLSFLDGLETPRHTSRFHITLDLFAPRKLFLGVGDAHIFYPGGFGTMDEFFEYPSKVRNGEMKEPVLLCMGYSGYWKHLIEGWMKPHMLKNGIIGEGDIRKILTAEEPAEAVSKILESLPFSRQQS